MGDHDQSFLVQEQLSLMHNAPIATIVLFFEQEP